MQYRAVHPSSSHEIIGKVKQLRLFRSTDGLSTCTASSPANVRSSTARISAHYTAAVILHEPQAHARPVRSGANTGLVCRCFDAARRPSQTQVEGLRTDAASKAGRGGRG